MKLFYSNLVASDLRALQAQGPFFVNAKSHSGKKTLLCDSTKQFEFYSQYFKSSVVKTYVKSFSKQDWQ